MLETRKKIGAVLVAVGLAVVTIVAAPVGASEQSEAALAALEEHFQTLTVEDGWLLQPLDGELGVKSIEVRGEGLAIDGQQISEDELRARLGGLAQIVLDLSAAASPDMGESSELEVSRAEREEARAEREEARAERRRHRKHKDRMDSQVVVGNDLQVEEDDVYRDIVVFGGSLTVDGQVIGDAVTIGGSAEVSGEITGDLAVIGGSIELEDGARVMGDVVSVGGSVEQSENVEVAGEVIEVPFGPNFNFGSFRGNWGNWGNWSDWGDWGDTKRVHRLGRHVRWYGFFEAGWALIGVLFCALLACLVFLLARNPVERISAKVAEEPWKSGLVGLLTQILCVPVLVLVCIVLLISVIGIPLLLLVPFAILGFILVAFLGYTAVAYRVGGWTENRFGWSFGSPYYSLLLGVGLIEVLALLGEFLGLGPGPIKLFAMMFVLFGCLVIYVTWTVGLGGAVLTRFGTWGVGGSAAPPPPPAEPLPPAPDWDEPSPIEPEDSGTSEGQTEHL